MTKLNDETGYTLIGVLAVFVILTVLGLSITMLSVTSVNTSTTERDDQAAFYIAEAGVNQKIALLEEVVQEAYEQSEQKEVFFSLIEAAVEKEEMYDQFEPVQGIIPTAHVMVETSINESSITYMIESTGTIGEESRTVEQLVTVKWEEEEKPLQLPKLAMYAMGNITVSGTAQIIGDIASDEGTVHVTGNGRVDGKAFDGNELDIDFPNEFRFPSIPDISPVAENSLSYIDSDTSWNTWNIESNVTIDTTNGDIAIVANDINMKKGKITIVGDGNVTFHVTGNIEFDGKINENGSPNQLNILLYKADPIIKWKNKAEVTANIFIENMSELKLSPSKIGMKGLLFASTTTINHNGGGIHGMVVADSYNMSGNAVLTFHDFQLENNPILYDIGVEGSNIKEHSIQKRPLREK